MMKKAAPEISRERLFVFAGTWIIRRREFECERL